MASTFRQDFLKNTALIADLRANGLEVAPEDLSDSTIERLTVGAEAYSRSLRFIVESANNVTRRELAAKAAQETVKKDIPAIAAPVPMAA